jgi:hypothetical protein
MIFRTSLYGIYTRKKIIYFLVVDIRTHLQISYTQQDIYTYIPVFNASLYKLKKFK